MGLRIVRLLLRCDRDGGASGGADTYWSKNKGRSAEGALKKGTTALAVLFFVLSIVLNLQIW